MSKSTDLIVKQRERQRGRREKIAEIFDLAIKEIPPERSQSIIVNWIQWIEELVMKEVL